MDILKKPEHLKRNQVAGKHGGIRWRECRCISNKIKYMCCVEIKDRDGTDY